MFSRYKKQSAAQPVEKQAPKAAPAASAAEPSASTAVARKPVQKKAAEVVGNDRDRKRKERLGEIKQELKAEAEADALLHGEDQSSLLNDVLRLFVSKAHAQEAWQDTITFTLEPGEYIEIQERH